MLTPKLLCTLPDYVTTPDGMAVDSECNLILACPNYGPPADPSLPSPPGCILKIGPDRVPRKWFDVPVSPETGIATPMGIAFGPDGDLYICDNQGWSGKPELQNKGRILRVRLDGDKVVRCVEVARHMEHPNGMRIRDGYVYVTQSMLSGASDPSGRLVSCVYKFPLDAEGIEITNSPADEHLLVTFVTQNPNCQYGADGIEFDRNGDLLVGNFGDGTVWRVKFGPDGGVISSEPWAHDSEELKSTDGMCLASDGSLYIADFSANAVVRVTPDGTVRRVAQSPDCDGLDGGLDQPGEPVIWNGLLVLSCFDTVTGPPHVNTAHELPATLAYLEIDGL